MVGRKLYTSMARDLAWSGDLSSWLRELLAISQRAWDSAASRDFTTLAILIEERDQVLKGLKAYGDVSSLPPGKSKEMVDVLLIAKKIDVEIRKALEHEMDQDGRAIRDTANKAKALTAYDRSLSKHRRFDRQK